MEAGRLDVLIHLDNSTKEQLQNHATRAGRSFDDYVSALLKEWADHPPMGLDSTAGREAELLAEYRSLVARKHGISISPTDEARLHDIEHELDDIDNASPGAQYMRSQADVVRSTLDQLIATVSALPDAGR